MTIFIEVVVSLSLKTFFLDIIYEGRIPHQIVNIPNWSRSVGKFSKKKFHFVGTYIPKMARISTGVGKCKNILRGMYFFVRKFYLYIKIFLSFLIDLSLFAL